MMTSRSSSVKTTRWILVGISYVLLIGWGAVAAAPLTWMVLSAFKPLREIYSWPPTFIPEAPTVDNFVQAWTRVPFARFILNSAFISIGQIVSVVFFGALVGYALAIRRFPGRSIIWLTVLSGLILPEQVTYIPRFMLIRQLDWINTYQGIMAPYVVSCFGVFLLTQFFENIPLELIDAANIDGLNDIGILFRIVLPLSRPALSTLAIMTWLSSWNNFFWPLLVVVSEEMRPIPVGLASFWQEEGVANLGHVLAANSMAIVLPLVIFIAFQRYFVQGISLSGLKG